MKTSIKFYPELSNLTHQQMMDHLEMVRARRMSAAVVYYQGINAKVNAQMDKYDRKLIQQFEGLSREFAALDRAIEKVEKRVEAIEILRQEKGVASLAYVPDVEGDE